MNQWYGRGPCGERARPWSLNGIFRLPDSSVHGLFENFLFPSCGVHQLMNYLFCSQAKPRRGRSSTPASKPCSQFPCKGFCLILRCEAPALEKHTDFWDLPTWISSVITIVNTTLLILLCKIYTISHFS